MAKRTRTLGTADVQSQKVLWHVRFGNAAQIASAIISLCGFILIFWQVNLLSKNAIEARKRGQENAARQVYMSYSEATLKYPLLSAPDYVHLKENTKSEDFIRYENYVAHMLFAYDEMLAVLDLPEWRKSFEVDLNSHMQYICERADEKYAEMYSLKMRKMLRDARQNCGTDRSSK
jgi:hypothetical protein